MDIEVKEWCFREERRDGRTVQVCIVRCVLGVLGVSSGEEVGARLNFQSV